MFQTISVKVEMELVGPQKKSLTLKAGRVGASKSYLEITLWTPRCLQWPCDYHYITLSIIVVLCTTSRLTILIVRLFFLLNFDNCLYNIRTTVTYMGRFHCIFTSQVSTCFLVKQYLSLKSELIFTFSISLVPTIKYYLRSTLGNILQIQQVTYLQIDNFVQILFLNAAYALRDTISIRIKSILESTRFNFLFREKKFRMRLEALSVNL